MTWELIAPGTWLIFGVIGLPVYGVFLGWFLGTPRDLPTQLIGVGVFISFVVGLWVNFFILTMIIGLFFF